MQRRAPEPVARRKRSGVVVLAGAALLLLAAGGGGAAWLLWPRQPPGAAERSLVLAPAPSAVATPALAPAAPVIPTATEAAINAELPGDPRLARFALNPAIVVLDFTTLAQQGAMLNRIAALVEKAGAPRDRVLNDEELAKAITASGATPETFYYGHDYRVADVARFFALADRDHVALDPDENRLRGILDAQGLLKPDAVGAIISLPAIGADKLVDASVRAVILHHELSHGEYFTDPTYAAYTRQFWATGLTEQDRAQFKKFLAADGYDSGIEDLMMNEMQAYLMHTRDPRFFSAAAVGLAQSRLDLLQAQFLLGMPQGWLRDCTPAPGAPEPAAKTAGPARTTPAPAAATAK